MLIIKFGDFKSYLFLLKTLNMGFFEFTEDFKLLVNRVVFFYKSFLSVGFLQKQ